MPRAWVWLQLLLGWLPVWALYTTLIVTAHPGATVSSAAFNALPAIGIAALLGLGVWRLTGRWPWPHPFRGSFLAGHLVGAALYAGLFALLTSLVQGLVPPPGAGARTLDTHALLASLWLPRLLVMGVWFYAMVAGVAYAARGTERAALAESLAAQSQLAALRAQLNPHFLFNALHTVVHLIPREPARAARAAEQVAGLLRTTIEEDRDLVPLAEEWAFVERYLEVERIRFGDRLQIRADLERAAAGVPVPCFALQTLVENAVRHGAAPRVEPTEISVTARVRGDRLTVTVQDTGGGATPADVERAAGTGLGRLRQRLTALYHGRARLDLVTGTGSGFTATLTIPQEA